MAHFTVTSYVRPDPEHIWPTVESWTSGNSVGVVDLSREEMYVYLELRQKYRPLVNAIVTATLNTPGESRVSYVLTDDGRGEHKVVTSDFFLRSAEQQSNYKMN
jgi:hypothetical protein